MPKVIFDGVLYDTRRCKKICNCYRSYKRGGLLTPEEKWSERIAILYAKDGTFLEWVRGTETIRLLEHDEALDNIKRAAPDKYAKLFDPTIREV